MVRKVVWRGFDLYRGWRGGGRSGGYGDRVRDIVGEFKCGMSKVF